MSKESARRAGLILLVVAASLGLATCSSSSTEPLAPTAIAVKRYLAGGGPDTAGFSGGAVFTKIDPSEFEYALAVALQADGKILAAGHSVLAGQGVIALVRYGTDGSLDAANFGSGGIVRTPVLSVNAAGSAIALQGTQILVAGSTFDPATGTAGIVLVRYNANGSLDTGFAAPQGFVSASIGPGTSTDTVSLALQADGKIVAAGATSNGNFVLRRYDSAGVLDLTFGSGGTVTTPVPVGESATTPAVALQSGGKIVLAGGFSTPTNPQRNAVLVRYNADGTVDASFGPGLTPNGFVFTDIAASDNFSNAIAIQVDDKIVVAGHARVDFATQTSDVVLLRYSPDGIPDTTFDGDGVVLTDLGAFDNALSVALQPNPIDLPNPKILVSGNTGFDGIPRAVLLRYTATGALDPTFGASGVVITPASGPSSIASGNAVVVRQSDGAIVVAGYD